LPTSPRFAGGGARARRLSPSPAQRRFSPSPAQRGRAGVGARSCGTLPAGDAPLPTSPRFAGGGVTERRPSSRPQAPMPQTETLTAIVPLDLSGLRFDQALAMLFPQFSRSRLT